MINGFDSVKIHDQPALIRVAATALAAELKTREQAIVTAANSAKQHNNNLEGNAIFKAIVTDGALAVKGVNKFASLYGARIFSIMETRGNQRTPSGPEIDTLNNEMATFCKNALDEADKIADHAISNIQTFTPTNYPKVSPIFQQFASFFVRK